MPEELSEQIFRAKTGISGLDDILSGGFPTGHIFLVEGEPGAGKTTIGLQFLLEGARNGERVLYITLSESEREIQQIVRAHGWSLENVSIFEYTPHEESLSPEDQYSVFHPSEIELQDTTQNILNRIEEVKPRRVVFDSLSEIRLLARDALRYRRQILALKHYFSNRNCTVLILDDMTAGHQERQLGSIVHGILTMEMLPRAFGNTRRRLRVTKLRGSCFREGYHDYTIRTGGAVVFPRLISSEHREFSGAAKISSGIAGLDVLWGGGLDVGTSTLFIGPAGAGKSSLSLAYACAAAERGDPVHVFLFDESVSIAMRRARNLGLKTDLLSNENSLTVEQIAPAELCPGEFVQKIRDTVEQSGTKMLVIDSLNGLLAAMPNEEHLILHLHELLNYLSQKGVTTILVLAEAGVLGAVMTAPVDLSYLADNVLLFRYFEAAGQVRKALSVVKARAGQHESTIRELSFRGSRIAVGEPLSGFRGILTGVPTFIGSAAGLQEALSGDAAP